jgi:UDP-3-O-acyl-N-acetylglucosamine deacetylase
MTFTRHTLAQEVSWSGLGLHSGQPVTVVARPAEDGIHFRDGVTRFAAIPENVTDTSRCTRLGSISTIEHLMSAFSALSITDVEVEVEGGELPALDGCAETYARDLITAGSVALGELVMEGLFARIYYKGDQHEIAIGKGDGWWRYTFVSDLAWIGMQDFETRVNAESYVENIAPARTFGFEREWEHIQAAGLGRGLNENNAFLLGSTGFVNPARFADEPARHKLLDLIGDLYLAGLPANVLNVVAERSGHTANVHAAAKLRAAVRVGPA